jgi:hypothetical protein
MPVRAAQTVFDYSRESLNETTGYNISILLSENAFRYLVWGVPGGFDEKILNQWGNENEGNVISDQC